MPTRRDGRVEPGQPIRTAFSATAWNRAQDAADVVLGQRPGFGAQAGPGLTSRLVVRCYVTTTVENVRPGWVVKINAASGQTIPAVNNDDRAVAVPAISGQVIVPVSLANYVEAKVQFGVIVGGTMPTISTPAYCHLCIAGLCIIRFRPIGSHKFLSGPVLRSGDTSATLTGAAESSTCGCVRLLQRIANIDASTAWGLAIL